MNEAIIFLNLHNGVAPSSRFSKPLVLTILMDVLDDERLPAFLFILCKNVAIPEEESLLDLLINDGS